MPSSYFEAIPYILSEVVRANPQSVLDVGVGFGKYGVLLRELLEVRNERYHKSTWRVRIDGVEVYPEYRNALHDYVYDEIYYGDIREVVTRSMHRAYDVILLIDVLEHFSKEDGLALIQRLLERVAKCLIISTPLYPAPQGTYLGNPHENHRSRWHPIDFAHLDSHYHVVPTADGGALIIKAFPRRPIACSVDAIWQRPSPQRSRRLGIAYILPHQRVTGGLKMLLGQARQLHRRGHHVRLLIREDKLGNPEQQSAAPNWAGTAVSEEAVIPKGKSLAPYLRGMDIVVAGWLDQLA